MVLLSILHEILNLDSHVCMITITVYLHMAGWLILLTPDARDSDYGVSLSPLSDFKAEMGKAGLSHKVVYLDCGDCFKFKVQ